MRLFFGRRLVGLMLDGRHHGEGKHDQRDMPMPAMPRPGFVVIESELVLGGLEAVLDRPTAALNADERVYRNPCRAPCGEVSEISISDSAPDQQAARPQAMVLLIEFACFEVGQFQITPIM
jgi:hypothetical protein